MSHFLRTILGFWGGTYRKCRWNAPPKPQTMSDVVAALRTPLGGLGGGAARWKGNIYIYVYIYSTASFWPPWLVSVVVHVSLAVASDTRISIYVYIYICRQPGISILGLACPPLPAEDTLLVAAARKPDTSGSSQGKCYHIFFDWGVLCE